MINFVNTKGVSIDIEVQGSGNFVILRSLSDKLKDKLVYVVTRDQMYSVAMNNSLELEITDLTYLSLYITSNTPQWVVDERGTLIDCEVVEEIPPRA